MVDVVYSIQECPCQFVAFLSKHLHTHRGIKLLLVVIVGVNKDCPLKYDVDTLAIIQRFISHHLPNGPSIPPQSVSFRFGWMNCDPFDAALVGASQGHCLSVEPYSLRRKRITLLCLCHKCPGLRNGEIILNETLLNCSIATFHFLPLIRHFHLIAEMDQVATSQHHFRRCALLPMYTTFLRLLRPIFCFAAKNFYLVPESSQLIVVHWHCLEIDVPVKNWLCVVHCVHKLVLHPFGIAKLPFVLVPLVSRNGFFKKPPHAAQKRLFSNDLPQSQITPV
jgi:hypothetical protein